jgi:hypothetical protein
MISGKTILFGPIDWGLGHSTRCVPIISKLARDNKVFVGVTPKNKFYFDLVLPDIPQVEIPSYQVHYGTTLPALWMVLMQSPGILRAMREERSRADEIVKREKIDTIISDNRFGLRNESCHNIFITHQLHPEAPLRSVAGYINLSYVNLFSEVWVPDYEDAEKRLSGVLSATHGVVPPVKFLGPQSALSICENGSHFPIDKLVILSGPEPQRSILEKLLIENKSLDDHTVFVRGMQDLSEGNVANSIHFSAGSKLRGLISSAKKIICRSGYSTLMDMHALGKTDLVLIPTPGQPEQKYLASYWQKKFGTRTVKQAEIPATLF